MPSPFTTKQLRAKHDGQVGRRPAAPHGLADDCDHTRLGPVERRRRYSNPATLLRSARRLQHPHE
jgi:hypothetical protein